MLLLLVLKEPVQPSKRLTVCINEDAARQSLFQDLTTQLLDSSPVLDLSF